MTTSLKGTRLDLTPDIRRQVDAMLAAALKPLGSDDTPAAHAAVEVEQTTGDEHRAEVTLTLGRATFRAEATAETLRTALAEVRQVLTRQVRDWRARRRDARRKPRPDAMGLPLVDDPDLDFDDPLVEEAA